MQKSQFGLVCLAVVVFFLTGCGKVAAIDPEAGNLGLVQTVSLIDLDRSMEHVAAPWGAEPLRSAPSTEMDINKIRVSLSAARSMTSWDERDPDRDKFNLPLLVLYRGQEAAPEGQRTLEIRIVGPVSGSEIQMEAMSHHEDVTTGQRHTQTRLSACPIALALTIILAVWNGPLI